MQLDCIFRAAVPAVKIFGPQASNGIAPPAPAPQSAAIAPLLRIRPYDTGPPDEGATHSCNILRI